MGNLLIDMEDLLNQLEQERRRVDFDTFDFSVKELVSMAENSIIDVAPAYQRQFRWPATNQSRFIESVFLGIPVPSLFMAANKDGSWELIDGVQRLSTLIHYVGTTEQRNKFNLKTPLRLEGLEVLVNFNGCTFDDLPQTLRLKFILRPLKVTTLSDKSDLKVRFDLFERLNTGGVKLTDQEIRSCVYRGRFNDFLDELSLNADFLTCINLTESKKNDGTKQELILRFFAYLHNRDKFEHSVVGFLNDYMGDTSILFNYTKNRELFEMTFSNLRALLPDGIKRGNRKVTPINLFEAVVVGAALAISEGCDISHSNVETWIEDEDLIKLTSGATNSRKRVNDRINYCYTRFKV